VEPDLPVRRQRVGAYAVCVHDDRVLLAQLSDRTGSPGTWTLPGGGIDHGEDPRDAVVREVHEETGLVVDVGDLLDVDSVHFTGRSPSGVLEDYHAVRLVFAGTVDATLEPQVQELNGSTMAAAWVPLAAVGREVPVSELVRAGLAAHRRAGG
jgi:8-oxo-dGTP diphosphatase